MMHYFCCETISCIDYALVNFDTTLGKYFEPERYFSKKMSTIKVFSVLFIPRWSMFVLIQAFHNISTLPMFHHEYNRWLCKT